MKRSVDVTGGQTMNNEHTVACDNDQELGNGCTCGANKVQHTPTPWIIRPAEVDENKFQIRHETERNDGMWWASVVAMTSDQICEEHGGTPEANAAYIVRAVNAHEGLLAVARELLEAIHRGGDLQLGRSGRNSLLESKVNEAIAKAEQSQ